MTVAKALLSSNRDTWCTPLEVLNLIRQVDDIGLDPCSGPGSTVNAVITLSLEHGDDGLSFDWSLSDGLVFVNPPYSGVKVWMEKCAIEARENNAEIIALVPSRTDTRWFERCWAADALCFWRGRLTFLGAPHPAPFPSAVVYWGLRPFRFADVFSSAGKVVLL